MGTFDGQQWTARLAGEFVMYRDKRRQIAVSIEEHLVLLFYFKE